MMLGQLTFDLENRGKGGGQMTVFSVTGVVEYAVY